MEKEKETVQNFTHAQAKKPNSLGAGRKLLLIEWLLVIIVFVITLCGRKDNSSEGSSQVWVAEFLPLEMDGDSYHNIAFCGDAFYFISYQQQGEGFHYRLSGYSLTDGHLPDIPLDWQDGKDRFVTSLFSMGEDGSFYVIAYVAEEEGSEMHLCRFDTRGKLVFDTDISGETDNTDLLAVDKEGRAYLSCMISGKPCILLYTSDGSYGETVMPDLSNGRISAMGCGADGKVYICCHGNSGGGETIFLAEINFENAKAETSYPDFPNGDSSVLVPGMENSFLTYDRTTLYAYDLTKQTREALFDWLDQDINGSYVAAVHVLEDGRVLTVTRELAADSCELVLLKKVDSTQITQKEPLVLGTLTSNSTLRNAVMEFNRGNEKYHVKIVEYLDPQTHDRADAILRMNNDILSDNCPDLLDLADLDLKELASKGLFVDLNAYLEQSSLFDRQDFLDSLLDAYTIDGELITIPSSFSLRTVFGWRAEVGDAFGWTLEELMAYASANPEAELFDGASRNEMMQYLIGYNEDAFIDWSSGECRFDSDAFKGLLEFVKRFPDEAEWDAEQSSTPVRIRKGEVLLYETTLADFDSIQLPLEIYGNACTSIGFPASDGSAGCMLIPYGAYGITVKSDRKEGAWEFLESLFVQVGSSTSFFPPLKDALAKRAADAVNVEYLTDEAGEICLDENGEPIPKNSGMMISYSDWEYTYRTATQDEVDLVLSLIDAAKPVHFNETNEVLNIITEEAAGYFLGQKTVDEVAEIIQSRVRIYVNEG